MVLFALAGGLPFFARNSAPCMTFSVRPFSFPPFLSLPSSSAAANSAAVMDGSGSLAGRCTTGDDGVVSSCRVTVGVILGRWDDDRAVDGVRNEPIWARAPLDGVCSTLQRSVTDIPPVSSIARLRFFVSLCGVESLGIVGSEQ